MNLSRSDFHYLLLAREESVHSNFQRVASRHTGCVVVYKKSIIARAHNEGEKTSPVQKNLNRLRFSGDSNPHLAHAEIVALNAIKFMPIDWEKVSVYTYREGADGRPLMARPCRGCMEFIRRLGIRNLIYTTDCGYAEEWIRA